MPERERTTPISEKERQQQIVRELLLREVRPIDHGVCAWEIAGHIVDALASQEVDRI
jgi:hypothetical protein